MNYLIFTVFVFPALLESIHFFSPKSQIFLWTLQSYEALGPMSVVPSGHKGLVTPFGEGGGGPGHLFACPGMHCAHQSSSQRWSSGADRLYLHLVSLQMSCLPLHFTCGQQPRTH